MQRRIGGIPDLTLLLLLPNSALRQPRLIFNKRSATALLGVAACCLLQSAQLAKEPLPERNAQSVLVHYPGVSSIPLQLNPLKLAGLGLPNGAWESENIQLDKIRPWPIAGWQIAELDDPKKAVSSQLNPLESIRARVQRIAAHEPRGYVAPVFLGRDGGPLIPTPTLLIGFEQDQRGAPARARLADFAELEILEEDWAGMPGSYKVRVHTPDGFRVLAIASELATTQGVDYAEPDWIMTGHGSGLSNDPLLGDLWGLNNSGQNGGVPDMDINAPEAWKITKGNSSLKVLVIDTGVQQDHPDIHQLPGADLTSEGPGTGAPKNQWDNHGTPVAGCASAIIDNGIGVVGSAPNCPTVSARTFIGINTAGDWTSLSSWTVDALAFGESVGARVTNNSNVYAVPSSAINAKYMATQALGMVHFACAGNESSSFVSFPASLSTVAAIGSINRHGNLASSSNHGVFLTFTAPGVAIVTTDRSGSEGYAPGSYSTVSGTSFASPYCAGVAALLLSLDPSLDGDQITTLLRQNVKDLGTPGFDDTFGWGLVDAHASALQIAPVQGVLRSWASDASGQVSSTAAGQDFIRVACGNNHSLGLRADSSIVSWGADGSGQVVGTPTGTGFIQVAAGAAHSLALRADGSIQSWGSDSASQTTNSPTGFNYIQIAAGENHSLALLNDGTIHSWGRDIEGQVTGTPTGTGYVQIARGWNHSLALRDDGSIEVWGSDAQGQQSTAPAGTGFIQIAGGNGHCLALHQDGSISSWGFDGNQAVSNSPAGTNFVQVTAGAFHSMALAADGSISSWGLDSFGTVSGVPAGNGYTQIAAGLQHGLALTSESSGNAYCFGDGTGTSCPCAANGQLGEGCANSVVANGALLTGSGNAQLSMDSFQLEVTGVPGAKPGIVLRGANAINAGLGNALGDGLLCVGGDTARSQVQITSGGNTLFTDFQGGPFGATSYGAGVSTNYQFWYRDAANTCSGVGFNFSNAWTVIFQP